MQTSSILLVEDNPDDVTLARRAFRKNNIDNEIIVAKDGAEALQLLLPADQSSAQVNPAIVLLDLNLPKVSGLDVLRRLRADERTEMLPIIMLTTSSEDRDVEYSYRLGANSFVRKPVNFDDFQNAARVLGEYWLEINEGPEGPTSAG
jgi:two-component system response regulator